MLTHIFTIAIYQPFFNLLVGIYWIINQVPNFPHKDMGVAVIIFTIALRIILLPLSLRASRTEKERFDIEEKVKEIKANFSADPVWLNQEMKKVFKSKPSIMFAEGFNLFIQIAIAIMLWRIFAKGLGGEDIHLLYDFMPNVPRPYNLVFWNIYDLTHPHVSLNIIQSILIFILEGISLLTSPFPVTRKDTIRLQIFLPVVSYIIFAFLPAGKKLFVITALIFSIIFNLIRFLYHYFNRLFNSPSREKPASEVVAIETKAE